MESCGIKRNAFKVSKELDKLVGTNFLLGDTIFTFVLNPKENKKDGEEMFEPAFVEWYKENVKNPGDLSLNPSTAAQSRKIAKAMKDYYFLKKPSVSNSTRVSLDNEESVVFGYSSVFEREEGIKHCADILLDEYIKIQNNGIKLDNAYKHYSSLLKNTWLKFIFSKYAKETKRSIVDIKAEYDQQQDKAAFIDKILGGNNKSITNQNIFAVYQELFASNETFRNYFSRVISNPILKSINNSLFKSLESESLKLAIDEANKDDNTLDDNTRELEEEEADLSIFTLNNHIGVYSSFKAHIGERLINYFNSLRRLQTPNIDDFDLNNTYGLSSRMTAEECASMIYNNATFTNVEEMIATIDKIGHTVKGFEAFVKIAADLREKADFATEMCTVFMKTKISFLETRVTEDGATVEVSNKKVDPKNALTFDLLNDLRATVIGANNTLFLQQSKNIAENISNLQNILQQNSNNTKIVNEIIKSIADYKVEAIKLLKVYFPSLNTSSILSFIELNNGSDLNTQINNILDLLKIIGDIAKNSQKSIDAYDKRNAEAKEIREFNHKLDVLKHNRERMVDPKEYKSTKSVYSQDYISNHNSTVVSLASKLVTYCVVNTDLNTRTIHGNNQSSVINNSLIARLSKMLEQTTKDDNGNVRNKILEEWGAKKLRSGQYKYSQLLLEQKDKEGNVINKALFRKVGNNLVLTEHAPYILSIFLFNGTSNFENGVNLDYTQMTLGDYIPSNFIAFFKTPEENGNKLATYQTRTPSDASSKFCIKAPRYSTDGLFTIEDIEKFENDIQEIINTIIPSLTYNEYQQYSNDATYESVQAGNKEYLRKVLTYDKNLYINDAKTILKIPETEKEDGSYEAYVRFFFKDANDKTYVIVRKGTIINAGKGKALTNSEIVGFINSEFNDVIPEDINEILTDYYSKKLKKSYITIGEKTWTSPKIKIDTTHPIFSLFVNQFKQEILEGAIAIGHYFELIESKENPGTYVVKLDKGNPVFRDKVKGNTKGYKFYHINGDKVFIKDGKTFKLTGNIFHSNKFTLKQYDEEGNVSLKNYTERLFSNSTEDGKNNDLINFLYGGALQYICDDQGQVIDVKFSEEQEVNIEEAISEFLVDYKNYAIAQQKEYESFIKDVVPTTEENITEFALNQRLLHYTFDELFEGNTKFYKDSQTVLKRAKEYQGSGVPYGIVDYSNQEDPNVDEVSINSELNYGTPVGETETFQELFKGTILEGVKQRNGFYGVTVKNTQRTNNKALDELIDQLVRNGVNKEHAMNILYGPVNEKGVRRGGFTDTKVNDAQSYITIQEWVRRIAARGQLQKYYPLIKKLLNENEVLTAADINEFVQVQKNFYYDLYYDKNYGIYVPRQIKNAEFVLVPRFIKGTQLEAVYNMMQEAGIDQLNTVETSKAANEEVLIIWDNEGNISDEVLSKDEKGFVSKAKNVKSIYSMSSLYTQQETPQHMNDENKAGVQIMKKIIDNILDSDPVLSALKQEFFDVFSTNISESAAELFSELEIPVDENGNVKLNENNEIEGLNKKILYNRLREEFIRTGIDKNLLDYVTISEDTGLPLMPSCMNNVLSKFESVVQSLFNNGIVRQKLPGFHAAQITNVGWKSLDEVVNNVSYSKELKYHPNEYILIEDESKKISERKYEKLSKEDKKKYKKGEPASYIEVMLPYSVLGIDRKSEHYKNMTDEEILAELEKEGLDMIIGYRIPTEGKQSVCNMKIVGLIDDATGSTIVVPDDWVSQTGSDFDIDSVYGIQFETYKTKDGKVHKIKYKKEVNKYDWFAYIKRFADKTLDPNVSSKIAEAKSLVKILSDLEFKKLQELETEVYNSFTEDEQKNIKDIQQIAIKRAKKKGLTGKEAYKEQLSIVIDSLLSDDNKSFIAKKGSEYEAKINKFVIALNDIYNFLNNQSEAYSNDVKEKIDSILEERMTKYNEVAKKAGLLTYEEFIDPKNIARANGVKARNTRILEIMYEILSNVKSLEENLSRSNFDDLVDNRNKYMNKNVAKEREYRSPYDFYDQARFQEDAMSGAILKGISVKLDGVCSICNVSKAVLERPLYIVYEKSDFTDLKSVLDRFDAKDTKGKTLAIRHKYYGWSKDYRNIAGKILTSYSSQTTAYILDAIKEGSLPNLNKYTFPAFKTLLNAGTDFKCAVSFIMQPGISRIVNANNANNSVFARSSSNPIHDAIRSIAFELSKLVEGFEYNEKAPISAVLESLNKHFGDKFNKIFSQNNSEIIKIGLKEDDLENLPIIVSKCINRLENSSSTPVENDLLFDLGVVLYYNKLHKTATEIAAIANCLNPDKVGTKQTVFSTREILENMDKCVFNKSFLDDSNVAVTEGKRLFTKTKRSPILSVDGKHILEALYPGIFEDTYTVDDMCKALITSTDAKSCYPSLYNFLKYATATSVIAAKTIFETENPDFVNMLKNITTVFSGDNEHLSEETYKEFQKYTLSSIYKECPAIKYPVKVRNIDGNISLEYAVEDETIDSPKEIYEERKRIYGYERRGDISVQRVKENNGKRVRYTIPFEVKDINDPTNEEMELFEELSPAQKIQWIQTNFSDSGIFSLLKINLVNENRGALTGMQTIEFTEENMNPNVVYSEFRKAFFNNNPLIVSAAIDLVKYSIVVEGMKMTSKAINKIIDNECLRNDFSSEGLGFIDFIRTSMSQIFTGKGLYSDSTKIIELYENYLRSHLDTKEIRTYYSNNKKDKDLGLQYLPYKMYTVTKNDDKSYEADTKEYNEKLCKLGIKYYRPTVDTYLTNKYVKIKSQNGTLLYKIIDKGEYVVLYPLSTLQSFENSQWSVNEKNNEGILTNFAYDLVISKYAEDEVNQNFNSEFIRQTVKDIKEKYGSEEVFYKNRKEINGDYQALNFDINEVAKEGGSIASVLETIKDYFKDPFRNDALFVNNMELTKYIFSAGIEFGSTQTIKINGVTRQFKIIIPEGLTRFENYYLKQNDNGTYNSTENIPNESLKEIINRLQGNVTHLSNLFKIIPLNNTENNQAYAASNMSIEQVTSDTLGFAEAMRSLHNRDVDVRYIETLHINNVTAELKSIKAQLPFVTRETAKYVSETAKYIKDKFENFVENPSEPNTYFKINDPEVLKIVKQNSRLLNEYMEAVNMAQAFINKCGTFTQIDTTSETLEIKNLIDDIKQSVEKVQSLPIYDVMIDGARAIAESQSTNPLIQDNVLDILDGYWKSYSKMWKFNDIQENGTPILQLILKDVMTDMDAKQKSLERTLKAFRKDIADIKQRAIQRGESIDMDKIVDKYGRLIQKFDPKFVDDYKELKTKVTESISLHGRGSIEHLKAKLDFDEFIATRIHQEAHPKYYMLKNALMRKILYGDESNKAYPEMFSKYMQLYYRKMDLLGYQNTRDLTEDEKDELRRINQEIVGMLSYEDYFVGDELFTVNPEKDFDAIQALNDYLYQLQQLNNEYFEYEEAYNFRSQLEKYLKIISDFERRDSNGIPTVPIELLESNPQYVEAKNWVSKNARYEFTIQGESLKTSALGERLKKAFDVLKLSKNAKVRKVNNITTDHDGGKGIYDTQHVPDGRLLSEEEIQKVKEAQQDFWNLTGFPPFSDAILISNAVPGNDIYTRDFYAGMNSGGHTNPEKIRIITAINKILEKYIKPDGNVHLEEIEDTEEGINELKELSSLYQQLRGAKKLEATETEKVKKFIEDNVEFVFNNETLWKEQIAIAKKKSQEFIDAYSSVVFSRDEDGNYEFDESGRPKANRYLYSYAKPKGNPGDPNYDRFIDKQRKEAIDLVNSIYKTVPTKYYEAARYQAYKREQELHDGSYKKWYDANHIYNPYTRQLEPLQCWVTKEIRTESFADNNIIGDWVPNNNQRTKKVRDGQVELKINGETTRIYDASKDKRNPKYVKSRHIKDNFMENSQYNEKYKPSVVLNQSEQEMRDYIQETLMQTAKIESARQYFSNGYLPRSKKSEPFNGKQLGREFAKFTGLYVPTSNNTPLRRDNIGYEYDTTPTMPMTQLLDSKLTIDIEKKLKERKEREINREEYSTESEYQEAIKNNNEVIKELEKQLEEERAALLNRDWFNVIECYLKQANRFNAILDNKQKLYYLLNILENYKMFSKKYGYTGDLKTNKTQSKDNDVYETSIDDNLIEQYKNQIRRLIFNEYKDNEGAKTVLGNWLQTYTSNVYMMLNVRGGVANVTLGEVGIMGEALAKDYFGTKDWSAGTLEWNKGIFSYARSGYHSMFNNEETAFSKQDAIIKYMNVVDYDEVSGVVRELTFEEYSKKVRDLMFSPQTIGEHFMQNSVLFAMMHSHKIVYDENGEPQIMNERNYLNYKNRELLQSILTEEQLTEFDKFKDKIKSNKNKLANYAWFRRDLITDFIYLHCSEEQRKDFIKKRKEAEDKYKEEFSAKHNLLDQCDLGTDGKLAFVKGSELDKLSTVIGEDNVSKTERLLAQIAEKTRKVNNKIHGVYNRNGASYIEKSWYGGLVMQYHKHLPIGILKRYMRDGYWNETRQSVEKGSWTSIESFLSLNLDKIKADNNLTDEELGALEGFTFLMGHLYSYFTQLSSTWAILPYYDKANIMRKMGDALGVLSAMAVVAALWAVADDEEEIEDAYWFNFMMYEADRLASEAFLYNPVGLVNEGKKLMSTPVAAGSIIGDATHMLGLIGSAMIDDDFQMEYQTGRFAGRNKFGVFISRRLPMVGGINGLLDLQTNNHYYKLGQNPIGMFNIKEMVQDE